MLGQVFNIAPRSVCCDGNPSCLPSRVCNRGNSKKLADPARDSMKWKEPIS